MTTMSPLAIMLRDELIGFARSKVMLVLWLLLPGIAMLAYFLIDGSEKLKNMAGGDSPMTATDLVGFLLTSLSGPIAALMVAVDIVSERQRKVYELFVIRPMHRDVILWAKFLAVFVCVVVACMLAVAAGITVDLFQGDPIKGGAYRLFQSLVNIACVVALATAVGVFVGSISRTILVAVLIVLYGGQNLIYVPMLPVYFGVLPNQFWLLMGFTLALAGALMAASLALFRKSEF
jgi:ABC-type transport system involved in multi-copper enzyme maturation permease subunit